MRSVYRDSQYVSCLALNFGSSNDAMLSTDWLGLKFRNLYVDNARLSNVTVLLLGLSK